MNMLKRETYRSDGNFASRSQPCIYQVAVNGLLTQDFESWESVDMSSHLAGRYSVSTSTVRTARQKYEPRIVSEPVGDR
jgi:hypothetical protein